MFPAAVSAVLARLEQAGFAAYAVGGCVRDTLLQRVPEDWDVTTAARPEQVAALFAGQCIPTGLPHGTVTVRQDGLPIEVTTFRADGPRSAWWSRSRRQSAWPSARTSASPPVSTSWISWSRR